jgi:hypothetical protein
MKNMESGDLPELVKPNCSHLYKYGRFGDDPRQRARFEDILFQHRLYAPMFKELRDPLEGKPTFAYQTNDQLVSVLHSDKELGVINRHRFTSEEEDEQLAILNYNVRLHGNDFFTRGIIEPFYKAMEEMRVYCLTKRWDHRSMWENYADENRGYCFEFANEGTFTLAREVVYDNTLQMDLSNPKHRHHYWLYCKDSDYKFEQEVRMVWPKQFKSRFIPIKPEWLTRIILGSKMPQRDRDIIRWWANKRVPRLKVVSAEIDEYMHKMRLIEA